MNKYLTLCFVFVLLGCSAAQQTASRYENYTTAMLWKELQYEFDPLKIAFLEAELGVRGEFLDVRDFMGRRNYLGRTSSANYGKQIYTRSQVNSDMNCSDFPFHCCRAKILFK